MAFPLRSECVAPAHLEGIQAMATTHHSDHRLFDKILMLLLSGWLLLRVLLTGGQAQVTTAITPDGTRGTTVTQHGNVYTIAGGTRPRDGPNLFHSFDRFSVGTGATASFTSAQTGIKHILSRVTGGQRSQSVP